MMQQTNKQKIKYSTTAPMYSFLDIKNINV